MNLARLLLRSRPAPALALAAALAAALPGCNFFRPEDPPVPTDPPPAADYSNPDQTLETIRAAIEDKRPVSASVYIGAFSDSTLVSGVPGYHQIFWPEDAAAHRARGGSVPDDWEVRLERRFFDLSPKNLLVINGGRYEAKFLQDQFNPDRVGDSDALLHRWYQIIAIDDDSGEVTEIIAQGYADLTFRQTASGNWLITRWEDRPDPEPNQYGLTKQPTWGQRRLESQ